ncbi:hypothetical protein A3G48_03505 [Candidatus Nomurabacteria bacterium RIFCSPLOWO2_12_FULL_40_42]|nr:MAG: hypothetical protein A2W56_02615 [Candidatus Nomurabacteria bacterium RIFCSPHIGHO2_02_41_18]OGI78065.1 MAG: hypothetical protein A3C65_03295 [Candidatus Nomurabacteria bacterium RIFCSPHIGHO2_02_FULL_41_150]OGI81013.1 MAG: hypothetical protein A3E03_02040 [Candidatus Nomurabacteria bacterium RIFCSPHIGHO2_12_FULL_40_64]OGI92206.1 MAG: hypothetical protein A3A06_03755 [Candidatus Nomurabacteria bacterium RIFCSPLOWO2_01_FULL_41_220]OGJ02629.1 MAG: hypothetical protein A3G48_03505 [Candidatu
MHNLIFPHSMSYTSQTPDTQANSLAPVVLSAASYWESLEKSILPIDFERFSYSSLVIASYGAS